MQKQKTQRPYIISWGKKVERFFSKTKRPMEKVVALAFFSNEAITPGKS